MTIKNTSTKILNIGTTILLPDQTMEASEAVCNTPALKAFKKKGLVAIEKTKQGKKGGEGKPAANANGGEETAGEPK